MELTIEGSSLTATTAMTSTKEEILKQKLEKAKAYLGNKLVTAKDSTFDYKREPTVLGQNND